MLLHFRETMTLLSNGIIQCAEQIIDFKLLVRNEIMLKSQTSCIKSLQNGYKFGNEISAR